MVEAVAFAGCTGRLLLVMHTKTALRSRDRMIEEHLSGSQLIRPSGCGLKGCCKVYGIPVGKIKTDKDTLSGGYLL
jgi:hypothetical protein